MGLQVTARTRPGVERFAEPASLFFSKYGLLFIFGSLLLAAWAKQTVIVIILALVLAAAGVTTLWSRLCLVGVSCERKLSENRVFPGETIELKLRVANRKLLPLPWITLEDDIPTRFVPDLSLPPGTRLTSGLLSKSASLLWYTTASWRQTLVCNKRGFYRLGPLTVTSGDILGMYPRSRTVPDMDHVIVYPRVFPIASLDLPSLSPSGDTKAHRRIFEDPIRLVGVREYTPHDSLRHIHWKATARHQSLQVKVFEPTTALKVAIFLGVDTFYFGTPQQDEEFELGISTAASIANYLIGSRSPVGLFVNTRLADSGQEARLLPSSGTDQLVGILELLAKVTPAATASFDSFIQEDARGLPWGTTMIFIFSRPSAAFPAIMDDLRHTGHRIMMYRVGGAATEATVPYGCQSITASEDLADIGSRAEP